MFTIVLLMQQDIIRVHIVYFLIIFLIFLFFTRILYYQWEYDSKEEYLRKNAYMRLTQREQKIKKKNQLPTLMHYLQFLIYKEFNL